MGTTSRQTDTTSEQMSTTSGRASTMSDQTSFASTTFGKTGSVMIITLN